MKCKFLFILLFLFSVVLILAYEGSATLYDQAREAISSRNYRSAELLLRTIIDQNDEYKERATYHLARSLFFQKRYSSSIFEFNRYLLICTDDTKRFETRYWIADCYFYLQDYLKAIEEYKRFLSYDYYDESLRISSYKKIGFIYFSQGRYQESIAELQNALVLEHDLEEQLLIGYDIALAYYSNREFSKAQKQIVNIKSLSSNEYLIAKCNILMGRILQERGEHKKAVSTFESINKHIVKKFPYYNMLYYVSFSHLALGNKTAAKSRLVLYLKLAGGSDSSLVDSARVNLAERYYEEKDNNRSLTLLFDTIDTSNDKALLIQAIHLAGIIYIEERNYSSARSNLEKIEEYEITFDTKKAYLLLVDTYLMLDQYSEAEELLNRMLVALQYDSDIDYIQYKLLYVYLRQKRYDEALAGFEKIRRYNPFSDFRSEYLFFQAVQFYDAKAYTKAEKNLKRYLANKTVENEYEARTLLSEIYTRKKAFVAARRNVNYIINHFPDNPQNPAIAYTLAVALKEAGEDGSFYTDYITRAYPRSQIAYIILMENAEKAFALKDYLQSENITEQLIRQGRLSVALYQLYFDSLELQHKYREIIDKTSQKEFSRTFENPDVRKVVARSYAKLGEYDQALYQYNLSGSVNSENLKTKDCYYLFISLLKTNREEKAGAYLDRQQLGEFYHTAALEYAVWLIAAGKDEAASELLSAALDGDDVNLHDEIVDTLATIKIRNKDTSGAALVLAGRTKASVFQAEVLLNYYLTQSDYTGIYSYIEANSFLFMEQGLTAELLFSLSEISLQDNKRDIFFLVNNALLKWYPDRRSDGLTLFARYYFAAGNFSKSLHYYQLLYDSSQGGSEVLYFLGYIYHHHLRNSAQAVFFYRKLQMAANPIDSYFSRGMIDYALMLVESNDNEGAQTVLAQVADSQNEEKYRLQAETIKSQLLEE